MLMAAWIQPPLGEIMVGRIATLQETTHMPLPCPDKLETLTLV